MIGSEWKEDQLEIKESEIYREINQRDIQGYTSKIMNGA